MSVADSMVISYEDDHKLGLGFPVQKQLLADSGHVHPVSEGLLQPWVSYFGIPGYAA